MMNSTIYNNNRIFNILVICQMSDVITSPYLKTESTERCASELLIMKESVNEGLLGHGECVIIRLQHMNFVLLFQGKYSCNKDDNICRQITSKNVNQKHHCRPSIFYSNMSRALVGKPIKETKFAEIQCATLHFGLIALKAIAILNTPTHVLTQIFYRV